MSPLLVSHTQIEPFMAHLGAFWVKITSTEHHVSIELDTYLCACSGAAHNGVLMTLLDVAMGRACRFADVKLRSCVTVEMKTSFIRPGLGRLVAQGVCLYSRGSQAFAEAKVIDQQGHLIASASGTFKYLSVSIKE